MSRIVDRLKEFLGRVLNRPKKKKRPASATNLKAEILMAKDVRFSWTPPTTRDDNTALPPNEKKEQRLSVRNAALGGFTQVATVAPDVTERVFPQVPVGIWIYRVEMIDTDDKVGQPADAPPVQIRSEAVPAAASNPSAVVI
jgi:hypothetical protein